MLDVDVQKWGCSMHKYCIIGAQGAGKSSFAYMLATYFKKMGKNVDVVQERVRYSPFPINQNMDEKTALWLYHSCIARELESIARGFNVTICDRSPLDSFIYAEYFKLDTKELNFCKQHAIKWLETYDRIFVLSPDIEITDDGIRGMEKDYQEGIDKLFKDHLELIEQYLKVKVIYLKSSDIFGENFNISEVFNDK